MYFFPTSSGPAGHLPLKGKAFTSPEKQIVRKKANQKAPLCKGSWHEVPEGLTSSFQSVPITKGERQSLRPFRPPSGPPRRQSLLHALAKNVPLAHFLNASRPLHKGGVFVCGKGNCVERSQLKSTLHHTSWINTHGQGGEAPPAGF